MSTHGTGGWGEEERSSSRRGLLGGSRLLTPPLPRSRARGRSYLDAYFVFSNGSALTLDQLSM